MNFLSCNKLKIILVGILFFIGAPVPGSAQTTLPEEPSSLSCGDMNFTVSGNFIVKPEQKTIYTVSSNSILDQQAKVEYELRQNDNLIEVGNEHQFSYLFTNPGTYLLKTILRRSEVCVKATEQTITVAKQIWLGIGLDQKEGSFLAQSVKSQGIGFVFIPATNDTLNEEATIKRIQQIAYFLPSSDVLFVEEGQARILFDHLDDMRTYGIGFPERIILVGNIGTSALRKLLHQSPTITNFSEIAITPTPYLSSVVQQLISGRSLQQLDVVRLVHPKDTTTQWWLPFSNAADYLLTHGMSINFLLFLLCVPFAALCLVILKQMVGFNVGGIYYTLVVSAATIFVGREVSSMMFIAALMGQMIAYAITKKIYLLYAPKVGLTITLTCIGFLVLQTLIPRGGYNIEIPTDPIYVFFPLITFSSMMQYIYPQLNSLIKKEWWLGFIQFIGGVVCVALLLQWSWLQQFVLGYPDSIIGVVIATIYIGRFAGLQLGEYIRFWPLVTKYFEDEE